MLEAELAHIHVAAGAPRATTPPGTLAKVAPRRSARGRADDVLFLTLGTRTQDLASPGLLDHLAQMAAEVYFGTPGSVTAALREAAADLNNRLLKLKQATSLSETFECDAVVCVLRANDMYAAQCGVGQLILVRPGSVSRWSSEEAASRPLGFSPSPHVSYHHLDVRPGDLLIMTPWPPPVWSDPTLSGLAGLDPSPVIDRLSAASPHDLTGLVMRLRPLAEAGAAVLQSSAIARARTVETPAEEAAPAVEPLRRRRDREREEPGQPHPRLSAWRLQARHALVRVMEAVRIGLARLLPAEPLEGPRREAFSPRVMAAIAVVVPFVVVAMVSVVYFRQGKPRQFDEYLAQAEVSIAAAMSKGEVPAARSDWEQALSWIELASQYGESSRLEALRKQAEEALDVIDLVLRLDFQPAVSGGFGPGRKIAAVAATASELYVLDKNNLGLWHAWFTGRDYEPDAAFECLNGPDSVPGMGSPVDIAIQPSPGALGTEGVVAIDIDGTVVYCAPDSNWASSQLTEPDIRWGNIQAIDVYGDHLYVLDPVSDAVFIYDASGGLFTGVPALYFASGNIPDLEDAVDLAMAEDELMILHADGTLDRCRRTVETAVSGEARIRVECDQDTRFVDERPGREPSAQLPAGVPAQVVFAPQPMSAVFFLDSSDGSVFRYSIRLVYQGRYLPTEPFSELPSSLALGPLGEIFLAVADQVYYAQPPP